MSLACLVLLAPLASAEKSAIAEPHGTGWFRQRFAIGGRLSVAGNALIGSDPFVHATSTPALRVDRTTEWTSGRVGGGVTLQYRVSDRLGIAVDFIHRRPGYSLIEERVEGVDPQIIVTTEDTRVRYYDVPALARFYFGRSERAHFRRFVDAGLTVRRVGAVRTSREITGPDDETASDTVAPVPANRTTLGWVAGAGVQATDDLGIHITPEVRYTHWMRDAFSPDPVRFSRHQLEFLVGITF